jgi:AdoMet-dependent rRNA methyltransferase SPB1
LQGYRARSAFKLIQLNKKFDFLSTARSCIDLCGAPGGWSQVAAKFMPSMSTIIAIDLLPIRPMRGVKTYQADITTQKCRAIIRKEVKGSKVDVVLSDGAPNVGTDYAYDAFIQNELCLVSCKLAVDVLAPNGWFICKVFRSQDYTKVSNATDPYPIAVIQFLTCFPDHFLYCCVLLCLAYLCL